MQSALLTNFKVLLALLFRDIVHQISKLIFYVTHISASFPTKNLDLSYNPLGQGITELATHLPSVPHLTKLRLKDTQMGEKEVTAVVRALKDLPELEWLDLSHNPLGRGVSELTQHLSSIPQLPVLGLLDVKMTKKEASELCAAVQGREICLLTYYHVSFLLSLYLVFTLCIFYLLILEKLPVNLF